MPAPDAIELIRLDTERRIAAYVIRPSGSGFRLVKLCPSGESHVGSFPSREIAEAQLLAKLVVGKV